MASARPNRNVAPSAVSPLASTRAIWSCTIWNEPSRQHHGHRLQIGADGGGIREQAVGRHQRRDGRKYREQSEEHDAGGGREQTVFIVCSIGTPQDVLPAGPGNLEGAAGKPAASVLRQFRHDGSGARDCRVVSQARVRCGSENSAARSGRESLWPPPEADCRKPLSAGGTSGLPFAARAAAAASPPSPAASPPPAGRPVSSCCPRWPGSGLPPCTAGAAGRDCRGAAAPPPRYCRRLRSVPD